MLTLKDEYMNDITVRRPIQWRSAVATDVGTVRSVNEDSVLDCQDKKLWVVADGMGGHDAGDVASRMIVDSLRDLSAPVGLNKYVNNIENRILDVNERLLEYSEIMLDGRTVGSTFVSMVIYDQIGVVLWMGDSRLYQYRGKELKQLSQDHSQVVELLQAGAITEEEAINHPDSNVITRAVGTSEDAYVELDVFNVQLGDTFLLCSDGLYNAVDNEAIATTLDETDPDDVVNKLIEQALQNGASDNVSVIAIKGVRQTAQ